MATFPLAPIFFLRVGDGATCIYQQRLQGSVSQPVSGNIENPDNPIGAVGAGAYGFAIYLVANGTTKVDISGLYSVTAP